MIDLTEEVLKGLTVGELMEALKDQDPSLPVAVFAGGDLWTPKQIVRLEQNIDLMPDDEVLFETDIIEFGCGWAPHE